MIWRFLIIFGAFSELHWALRIDGLVKGEFPIWVCWIVAIAHLLFIAYLWTYKLPEAR
jgi:hypothetical protein